MNTEQTLPIELPQSNPNDRSEMTEQEIRSEYAMIGAIISDNFMKRLYEIVEDGYVECVNIIADVTERLVSKCYPGLVNIRWDEYLETFNNHEYLCWDDFVIGEAEKLLKEDYKCF